MTHEIQVESVIDHHFQQDWIDKWQQSELTKPLLPLQIEAVASCATLIAEKFYETGVVPSEIVAKLLLFAIWSNSLNFGVTELVSEKDTKMAEFLVNGVLKKIYGKTTDAVENLKSQLFIATSSELVQNPVGSIGKDTKVLWPGMVKSFPDTLIGIGQLEVFQFDGESLSWVGKCDINQHDIVMCDESSAGDAEIIREVGSKDRMIPAQIVRWMDIAFKEARRVFYAGLENDSARRHQKTAFLVNFVLVEFGVSVVYGDDRGEILEHLGNRMSPGIGIEKRNFCERGVESGSA